MWISRTKYEDLESELEHVEEELERAQRRLKVRDIMLEMVGTLAFQLRDGKGFSYEMNDKDEITKMYSNDMAPYIDAPEEKRAQTQE